MRSLILVASLAVTLTLVAFGPAAAAPNIYGTGGLIEIPDDTLYPVGSITPAYHGIFNIGPGDEDLSFFTVGVGILPNLSVSGGVASNGDDDAVINAKYRLTPESADRPSITIGVVDAVGDLNTEDDPGFYILFAKNLTAAAEEVVGGESKPLRGYLGFGSGVLSGLFLGLDWTLTPKISAMLEYVNSDEGPLDGDSHFNGGIRIAVSNELRIDLGLIDFDDFTAGISYNVIRF
ncbi:MAG: hypothetical protein HYX78_05315 [Armatimonadetes bacterium]|nr:hypothetical protein [Armatimonadota bacterium]